MTEITVSQIIKAFIKMEKYGVQFGAGGTPLPAPLGNFPLSQEVASALKDGGLLVTKGVDNCLTVSDTGKWLRRFGPRTPPTLWVWPNITLDYTAHSVVCDVVVRTGDSETFPISASSQFCRAISANYLDCHSIICEVGQSRRVSESWNNLGFGEIFPLSQLFERFMDGRQALERLARSDLGIFSPNPTLSLFVAKKDASLLSRSWQAQLEEFAASIVSTPVSRPSP